MRYYGTFKGDISADTANVLSVSTATKANTVQITNNTSASLFRKHIHFGNLDTGYDGVEVDSSTLVFYNRRLGIGIQNPEYDLDLGESSSTIRLVSEDNGTAIRIGAGGGDNDVTLLRIDGDPGIGSVNIHGESDSSEYGFSVKYMGGRSSNNMSLSIFSDNQRATEQIEAVTILQDGTVGIGTNRPDLAVESATTSKLAVGILTAHEIYGNISGATGTANNLTVNQANKIQVTPTNTTSTANTPYYIGFSKETTGYADFRIDTANDLVFKNKKFGIGTNDPSEPLSIESSTTNILVNVKSTQSSSYIRLSNSGNTGNVYVGSISKDLILYSNFSNSTPNNFIRLTEDGNVGIGTAIPTNSVNSSLTSKLAVGIVTANEFHGTFKGTLENSVVSSLVTINDDGGDTGTHYIHMGDQTSGSDGVEIDSTGLVYKNGQLGIGTDDPQGGLDVYSDGSPTVSVRSRSSGLPSVALYEQNSGISDSFGSSGTFGFRLGYDGSPNRFEIDSCRGATINTRLVIDRDSGNVSIGDLDPDADTVSVSNTARLMVGIVTANEYYGEFKGSKVAVQGPLVEKFTRISGTSANLDLRDGNVFQLVLGSSTTTVSFTNCPASSGEAYAFTLIVSNTGTAGVTITWPTSIKWAGTGGNGNTDVPTRTEAANKSDVWVFTTYDEGTTWLGVIASFGYDQLPTS